MVPTVSIDYFFMGPSGQEEAQGVLPMLTVKSHDSRMTFAPVVERKGPVDSTTRRLVADLDWLGLRRLVFKSDQELVILVVKQVVGESMPTVEFVMEESSVEEHQSNGTIEVTVREIQKQVRVMKSALEVRMTCEVLSRHPILAFLVEHAGRLMSWYQVGRDGRTAYELHAGKPYRRQLVEFGERVYFMPIRPGGARQAKLDPKWQHGAFIGIRDRRDEMLIMTTTGVYKTRNVRRRPESERWDFEFLVALKGTPWNPNPAAGEMAADAFPADMAVPMPAPAPVPQVVVAAAPVDRAASRVYIKKADVQKFGYSMKCPGCRSVMTNTTARAHTEECRKRLEGCLAEDEETKLRWEAAKLRVDNWLASRVESTEKPRSGDAVSHEPCGAASSSAPAAAASGSVPMAVSSSSADERFRSDEVPNHGVMRVRWSLHEQDTKEFDPNESSVQIPSQEHNRGLKRQPESTTEDLEDGDDQENRGDADDDDMKALGAVPVITIGVDGETLDECESVEESYVDDVNGGFVDPEMVREVRVEELAGYLKMQVCYRVPVAEIGSHKVIKTRWVDTNKGDERSPEIRCRLVAKEVKKRNNTEEGSANFFASTPPLEAVKFLISEAMTKRVSRNNRPLKLSFIDVEKAHLRSDVLRELYVEPPTEANEPPDIVWRLQRAMYSTRDAGLRGNVSGQKR